MPQTAISLPEPTSLHADAEEIAGRLLQVLGGNTCYLALSGNAGQKPRLLLAVSDDQIPLELAAEISLLLRGSHGRTHPLQVEVAGFPALVLPLVAQGHHLGAAVVLFRDVTTIHVARAAAAAVMTASALDAMRRFAAVQVQAEEIVERARTREIQVSRNLIRGVIDSIPMGLVLLDADGTVLAANRALSDRVGLDPAALVGMHYASAIGAWEQSPARQTFASAVAKRVRRQLPRADGGQALVEISSFPLLDADERPRQVVEVWEDITERVSLHTQLVRAEKLAAIGQLAASIAHEVGNPLQAIQGFLELFLEQCAPDTPNRNFLELSEDEIERIVQVIARLRDLYRPRADVVAPVILNDLVNSVLLLTSKQMEHHRVQMRAELAPNLPQVQVVADQIKQVLLNLVLNAIDAMKAGGALVVRTVARNDVGDLPVVDIMISDTGIGILPDQIPHIFDGLHTTKDRGMGLGLYTSKAIIERHMGRISVASTLGEGTTFTITLPIELEGGAR